jgi:hypothetical protein
MNAIAQMKETTIAGPRVIHKGAKVSVWRTPDMHNNRIMVRPSDWPEGSGLCVCRDDVYGLTPVEK